MTNEWNDFNDATQNDNLIPKGTTAKVKLTIRPGGFDDPSQGWTGGYAKQAATGSVYLDVECTVLEGPYVNRKVWSMIGLRSPRGPAWANRGRSLIRGILNSARGISDRDNSPEAQNARRISDFAELDGIEFVARIDIGKDSNGDDKNDIRSAVTPDHVEYAAAMGGHAAPMVRPHVAPAQQAPYAPAPSQQQTYASQQSAPTPTNGGVRPTWAK